jgi:HPt (histidine-containing phosphotransfer) domain-containing protein
VRQSSATGAEPKQTIDRASLLAGLDGDTALLEEMIDIFLEDCPKRVQALLAEVSAQELMGVSALAHTLRGTIGTFTTSGAYCAAYELEKAARQLAPVAVISEICSRVVGSTTLLLGELGRFREELAASKAIPNDP